MSGGSFDYFYEKLEGVASQIHQEKSEEERELSYLCKDLANVLHDLEWYVSGDTGFSDFKKGYNKFKAKWKEIYK